MVNLVFDQSVEPNPLPKNPPLYVTQPSLPPLEEFIPYLESIWASKILTNGGPFHQQLEEALCTHLGVQHISLFTNGTIALVTALQALDIQGEVITTPYSFIATAHSLIWNTITPVFVDIDPNTLNIDPARIEAAITPKTTAILAVHCYGTPCNTEAIDRVAKRHNLKVIYDAAHAFGVQENGQSILNHGDLSVLSFHATKVFNTFEGGAIVCPDAKTKLHIDRLKNFGIVDEVTVSQPGINGKMCELNAAMGLLQLRHVNEHIAKRKAIDSLYRHLLQGIPGITLMPSADHYTHNYAYFPILVHDPFPLSRDDLYTFLKQNEIHSRRYFYPLISTFSMYQHLPSANHKNLPIATETAEKVLCLPLFSELSPEDCTQIAAYIRNPH
ncbi:MAG: DegT/DnrJ/EryC1/StrS family aminotransferase [Candidatus Margulisiibacteriota bacterium]